ncbi:MAG: hypothetical protein QMB24_09125 [Spirosomataceae bacterium]
MADYILTKDRRTVLTHIEVPKSMEGQGIGSKLANLPVYGFFFSQTS